VARNSLFPSGASGCEWVVEAHGCDPARLRDRAALAALFRRLVADLSLHVLDESWHQFPDSGGVTGLALLAESHLAVHTFPEFSSLCLNVFCCRPREDWNFEERLREMFAAEEVVARRIERPYQAGVPAG
jgi:S-adenosylmethionine decarboxylase